MKTWLEVWENGKCYGNNCMSACVWVVLWKHSPVGLCFHSFLEFSQTPTSTIILISHWYWWYLMRNWWLIIGKQTFVSVVSIIITHEWHQLLIIVIYFQDLGYWFLIVYTYRGSNLMFVQPALINAINGSLTQSVIFQWPKILKPIYSSLIQQ